MKQFKIGDRVVRVDSTDWFGDGDFMKVGNEYVVREHNQNFLYLEGSVIGYRDTAFNLAEEKQTFKTMKGMFKNMKFKVESPEQSKEIQEALFSMGYAWGAHGMKVMWLDDNLTTYIQIQKVRSIVVIKTLIALRYIENTQSKLQNRMNLFLLLLK
jgi:hypothetical protein